MLEAAIRYAKAGWAVLPLQPRGKAPLTPHGVKDATTDIETIRGWWRRWPHANLGLAVPSGYLVVDLDSPDVYARLRAEDLELPATVTATTGRGVHKWYSTGQLQVRNRVALLPGIDIRAPGGYIVAPPSVHPSGAIYSWQVELRRSFIAPCPEWLLERLREPSSPVRRSAGDWAAKLREIVPAGRRNQALAEVCGLLFRKLPADAAAELAICWATLKLRPQLPDSEVRRTIESIAGRELRRCGGGV